MHNAQKMTFLTVKQNFGDALSRYESGLSDAIQSYGRKASPTDLAVLLGSFIAYNADTDVEGNLSCPTWLLSSKNGSVCCINCAGNYDFVNPRIRQCAARPVLTTADEIIEKVSTQTLLLSNGQKVKCCKYGEYPQTVACEPTQKILETFYLSGNLKGTGKHYTFDAAPLDGYDIDFQPLQHCEYVLGNQRYIRVQAKQAEENSILSDGRKVQSGQAYWVQVQPIEWLVDAKGVLISKKCLFAGIPFDSKDEYDTAFEETLMYRFLNKEFAEQIQIKDRKNILTRTLNTQKRLSKDANYPSR